MPVVRGEAGPAVEREEPRLLAFRLEVERAHPELPARVFDARERV
jgi:hypothetical protein